MHTQETTIILPQEHVWMPRLPHTEYCRRIYSALSGHEELHRGFSLVS